MNPRILISLSSFATENQQPLQLLQEHAIDYCLNPYGRKLTLRESIELMQEVDGLIAGTETLNQEVLLHASKLKVISRCGSGIDSIDMQAARELGIAVFNTPDIHVDAVAELTLGGILNVIRRISFADRGIRHGEWSKPMGALLRGKTVGIIGLGRVGKALVRLLRPFDNSLLAFDLVKDEAFAQAQGVRYCSLDELVRASDIITLHPAYTRELHHLIDRSCFALMQRTVILVNCARGGLIDEDGLCTFLRENPTAGAYLDTFEQEPYAGPLVELPNALLTSHIGSYARESRVKMELEAVENLCTFFKERGQL